MASLEARDPEVILLDLALAHPEEMEVVRRLHLAKPAIPFIVIGDVTRKETVTASLREGATDYLLKGQIDPQTLDRALRGALERNTLKGLADLLRDPLTGLYIRDGFLTVGGHAMDVAKDKGGELVLLCARVENLNFIQKELGQNAVESSLRQIANLLSRSFRRTDVVGRIGESQFAALAVDAIEPSVPVLLQRLQKRLEALNREIGPRGPLELRMTARFWHGKRGGAFSKFLDEVEAGLRVVETVPGEKR